MSNTLPLNFTALKGAPPPDPSPALIEPEWINRFHEFVDAALRLARKFRDDPRQSEVHQICRYHKFVLRLSLLKSHLLMAWNRRDEADFYLSATGQGGKVNGPRSIVIDLDVREAYDEAWEMFAELGRREEASPGKPLYPVTSLEATYSLLDKVIPKQVKPVSLDEARDKYFYDEAMKPKKEKLADSGILARAKRLHPEWNCEFTFEYMR